MSGRVISMGRRGFCAGGAALAIGVPIVTARPLARRKPACVRYRDIGKFYIDDVPSDRNPWVRELHQIENCAGRGDLGAIVLDTGNGCSVGWQMDERFAMCSSFKFSLAALALQRIAAGQLHADERIPITVGDLLPNSPRSERHLATGMSVLEMAQAAQEVSDNAAANLLLRRLGGPAALTAFWRTLGDSTSRLDDYEPQLNRVRPGDSRNTTTPRAMANAVARLLAHGGLPTVQRDLLLGWMKMTQTGHDRIRAGLPAGWWAGDKTGTASESDTPGACVDLALVRPPGRAPLVIAAFLRVPPHAQIGARETAILAQVGALAARWALAADGARV